MNNSFSDSYKEAGVDITAGYRAVELMKLHVVRTMNHQVISGLGGFSGLFEPDLTGISHPVMVSATDGVGTKLKLAFLLDRHDTIGIDCVAMCVNDLICCGAKPLFFLDYIALDHNVPEKVAQIVSGVAEGCVQAGAALMGGETAEMPGFYAAGEYDLAGFAVGIVDKEQILRHDYQKKGDVLIALPSSGVHSNGFSLLRRLFDLEHADLAAPVSELAGASLGEILLTPTKIYVSAIQKLLQDTEVRAISHITGGGLYENVPRSLPQSLTARIDLASLRIPPLFDYIKRQGDLSMREMCNVFNMGVGMIVSTPEQFVDEALRSLQSSGEEAYVIGDLTAGEGGLKLC